jgi:hypothetical protein
MRFDSKYSAARTLATFFSGPTAPPPPEILSSQYNFLRLSHIIYTKATRTELSLQDAKKSHFWALQVGKIST